jgi:NADP-dependent 3-hydroxy acid dehydrogenase YdfG
VPRQVAIVTGGSRGIGYACVERLLRDDWNVVLSGRSRVDLDAAARRLGSEHRHAVRTVVADVSHGGASEQLVSAAVEAFGGVDAAIANAGTYASASVEELRLDEWSAVLNVNLTSVLLLIQAALPHLRERHGYVIAIGSVSGTQGFVGEAAYGASKRALRILTDVVTAEYGSQGVRGTVIAPGVVRTSMAEIAFARSDFGPEGDAPGLLEPADVAETVAWLLRLSPTARVAEVVLGDSR